MLHVEEYAYPKELIRQHDDIQYKFKQYLTELESITPITARNAHPDHPPPFPIPLADQINSLVSFEDYIISPLSPLLGGPIETHPEDVFRMVRELSLNLHPEDLRLLVQAGVPDGIWFHTTLRDMLEKEEPSASHLEEQRRVKMIDVIDGPTAQPWITQLTSKLYQMRHTDPLSFSQKEISETNPELRNLQTHYARLKIDRDDAHVVENIVMKEAKHRDILRTLEKIMELRQKRLAENVSSRYDVQEYLQEAQLAHDEIAAEVEGFELSAREIQTKVENDINIVSNSLSTRNTENAQALEQYAQSRQLWWDALRDNTKEHEKIWRTIVTLFSQLHDLSSSRADLVSVALRSTMEEHRRIVKHVERVHHLKYHLSELRLVRDHAVELSRVVDSLKTFRDGFLACVEGKQLNHVVERNILEEAKMYLDDFTVFVKEHGDLTRRKEQYLDSMERQARIVQHKLGLAPTTMDERVREYEEELKELIHQKELVHKDLIDMHVSLEKGVSDFRSAEEVLRDACYEFEHPLLLYQEEEVIHRARVANEIKERIEQEHTEVESTVTRLRKAVQESLVERDALRDEQKRMKQALPVQQPHAPPKRAIPSSAGVASLSTVALALSAIHSPGDAGILYPTPPRSSPSTTTFGL